MENILLKPLHHRGQEITGLYFVQTPLLSQAVRQIQGAKWSRTHSCWYVPCTRYYYNSICTATCSLAVIDTRLLKEYLQQKQGLVTNKLQPLHKATAAIINQHPLYAHNLQSLTAYRNMLQMMKYSVETIRNYCNAFHQLLRLLGPMHIDVFTKERIQAYMLWLVKEKNSSEAHLNMVINAIKFYFEKVLCKDKEYYDVPRPRRTHKLPNVLAEVEIVALIKNIENLKHRTLVMVSYSAGLRVQDLVNLKIDDVEANA